MSEEKKPDYTIETGAEGEPIVVVHKNSSFDPVPVPVKFTNDNTLNEILTEMADKDPSVICTDVSAPSSFSIPRYGKGPKGAVEVAPGVMVSQHLIDAAVADTLDNVEKTDGRLEEIERARARAQKINNEIRQDITTSQKFVQEMVDRLRNPMKYDEKYVSFDQMPKPLQRVVNAYVAMTEATKELEEAIKGLQSSFDVKPAEEMTPDQQAATWRRLAGV